jgi:hypothetical protein
LKVSGASAGAERSQSNLSKEYRADQQHRESSTHPLQLKAGSEWWAVAGMIKALIEDDDQLRIDAAVKTDHAAYLSQLTQAVGKVSWTQIKNATDFPPSI